MLYYGAVFGFLFALSQYGSVSARDAYVNKIDCEARIPHLKRSLLEKFGPYQIIASGCKSKAEWLEIIGKDLWPGRDL